MAEKNHYKTDHVNHDPVFCLAPGVFRSAPNNVAASTFMDVVYETRGRVSYRFMGPILRARELRVLQGLVAISAVCGSAADSKFVLRPDTATDVGKEHRRTLELKDGAVSKKVLIAKTSLYELAKEIGYSPSSFHSGAQIRQLRKALDRLWAASIIVEDGETGEMEGSRLISKYKSTRDGKLFVALNFHITETVLGTSKKYTRLDMNEIRALRADPARLIHQRLCGWLDPGMPGAICLDTLCEYVWYERTRNPATMRTRRHQVRKALKELESLGWTVDEYVTNQFRITRRPVAN
jgi:hypothetical protein